MALLYYGLFLAPRIVLGRMLGRPFSRIVVLTYHGVQPRERASFARQLDTLRRAAAPVVPDGDRLPRETGLMVALTFDDGYANIVANALPELAQRRIPAMVFVPSANLGLLPGWSTKGDPACADARILSASEIRDLSGPLVRIGSHTCTHAPLTEVPAEEAFRELRDSRADLERIVNAPVDMVAFPYGRYDRRVEDMARRAGYRRAFTMDPQCGSPGGADYLMGRFRVDPSDWGLEFWLKVRGAYQGTLALRALKHAADRVLRRLGGGDGVTEGRPRTGPPPIGELHAIRYAIVTPVKNEEAFLAEMVNSVAQQTIRPSRWIIVDDGSTDRTAEIVRQAASTHEWIRGVRIEDTGGGRKAGGEGVLPAGLRLLDLSQFDFLARLDGDVSFEPDYFERLFAEFQKNPRLGIASGVCYARRGAALVEEKHPRFHTRGALKTYRVSCFHAIGGLDLVLGWDIVDEVRANMLGWETRSFPHLPVIHHRPTQTAIGWLRGLRNPGRAAYYTGYHPLFLLARVVHRLVRSPYLIGGILLAIGYLEGYFARQPRVEDPALIRYLRRQQLNRLVGRETIWR